MNVRARLFLALLLLSASALYAAPSLTGVFPKEGFSFAETRVQVRGTELTTQFVQCQGLEPDLCPIQVYFGQSRATVLSAHPEGINVIAWPQPDESTVDVRVRLANGTEVTRSNAFHFSQYATPVNNFRQYLVPLTALNAPGAHGSLWMTEFTVHNATEFDAVPIARFCPDPDIIVTPPCSPPLFDANWTQRHALLSLHAGGGAFLHVPEPLADGLDFELRVRDRSREDEGFGTEIPVVPVEREFRETVQLVDIPNDPRYRVNLRIYGHDHSPRQVTVKVFSVTAARTLIEERIIDLAGLVIFEPVDFTLSPAYAQIDPITDTVRASAQHRLRIEVSYLMPPLVDPPFIQPIWAFASITNNETQEVTTITPHSK